MGQYRLAVVVLATIGASGCTPVYESACHELASRNRGEVQRRVRTAANSTFERHFILIETGNEMSSKCRSSYIDERIFQGLPESLREKCRQQISGSGKYCLLYQLDGEVLKQRINEY